MFADYTFDVVVIGEGSGCGDGGGFDSAGLSWVLDEYGCLSVCPCACLLVCSFISTTTYLMRLFVLWCAC